MNPLRVSLSLLAVSLLAGCATTGTGTDNGRHNLTNDQYSDWLRSLENNRTQPVQPSIPPPIEGKPVNITPLSSYSDDWSPDSAAGGDFADAYTRLLILSRVNGAGAGAGGEASGDLAYKSRPWLARALVERDFSVNLTAKVSAGSFEATVPLATVSHQSGSQGEQWSRTIHHTRQNFPLFLVPASGSASTPTLRITVNGDRSYSSRAAATAVQVALNVANVTGQTSRVITALSKDSARNQARAMDEAISKLFGSGLTEEHWSDRDLRYWSADATHRPRGARVSFEIPSKPKDWNSPPLEVGEWTVTFDYPRPSVFADWRICGAAALPRCAATRDLARTQVLREISAGEILNYPIAEGEQGLGTIRAYLAQKDWFTTSQAALADPRKRGATANALCRMIVNEITGIGLNGFDADLVVWAVTNGMPIANVQALKGAEDCKRSLDLVAAGKGSAAPAAVAVRK